MAHDPTGAPALETNETAKSNEGVIRMCEEAHYEGRLLLAENSLDGLAPLSLGDSSTPTSVVVIELRVTMPLAGAARASSVRFARAAVCSSRCRAIFERICLGRAEGFLWVSFRPL